MGLGDALRAAARPLVDYALPPRCAACGVIVDQPGTLCVACWQDVQFIGEPICVLCGMDLPAMADAGTQCGACLATPPPYDRARAVMRYGTVGRTVAHRLKYGRRVGLATVMAAHMMRLLPADDPDMLLVPVPLHRWRIWSRGFNQAALIARALGHRAELPVDLDLLRRVKRTPPLHSLGRRARIRAMQGAFALRKGERTRLTGRTVVLIDDIWTTGTTATACARLLRQGGAARVEILCWSRVSHLGD